MSAPDDGYSIHNIVDAAIAGLVGLVSWLGVNKFSKIEKDIDSKASNEIVTNLQQTLLGHISETRDWRKDQTARLDKILDRIMDGQK
jgi:hypothetical protein